MLVHVPSLNSEHPLLFYASHDSKIVILSSSDGKEYQHYSVLKEHNDWVMTMDYKIDKNGKF